MKNSLQKWKRNKKKAGKKIVLKNGLTVERTNGKNFKVSKIKKAKYMNCKIKSKQSVNRTKCQKLQKRKGQNNRKSKILR